MSFRDHFSGAARDYAAFRPRYPAALFAHLASLCTRHERAWDCATGSGQAAAGLAAHFAEVVATDASAAQVAHAAPHERVRYAVATAEASGLPGASVDLVTVAQALHWFDVDAFWRETRRVLRPGGVVAAWGYGLLHVDAAIDAVVRRFAFETLAPYWPPERALVDAGYETIPFPFDERPFPALHIEQALTLDALASYLRTWSAALRYREARGHDAVDDVVRELAPRWGEAARVARWPLFGRIGVA